jgi:hypothetical protein
MVRPTLQQCTGHINMPMTDAQMLDMLIHFAIARSYRLVIEAGLASRLNETIIEQIEIDVAQFVTHVAAPKMKRGQVVQLDLCLEHFNRDFAMIIASNRKHRIETLLQ